MKNHLISPQLAETLARFPLYSQDGRKEDAVCVCAFSIGRIRWYVLEGEPEGSDFTLFSIVVGMNETEYGYVSVHELESIEIDARGYGLGTLHVCRVPGLELLPLNTIPDRELQDFLVSLYR